MDTKRLKVPADIRQNMARAAGMRLVIRDLAMLAGEMDEGIWTWFGAQAEGKHRIGMASYDHCTGEIIWQEEGVP